MAPIRIVWFAPVLLGSAAIAQTVAPPASPPPPPIATIRVGEPDLPYTRPDEFPAEAMVLNDPGSWITSSDYPAAALRERREGRVGVETTVSNYGRVTDCRVVQTSSFSDLDETACQMVTRRARFRPAYDTEGRAVQGVYRTAVVWRLPLIPMIQPFSAEFEFDVEADGTMTHCQVIMMKGGVPGGLMANNPCTQPVRYKPATDSTGKPVRRHVRLTYGGEAQDIP